MTGLTSPVASSAPHGLHEGPSAPGGEEHSPGSPHHGPIIGARPLLAHGAPGQLVVGPDLIAAALKDLYVPGGRGRAGGRCYPINRGSASLTHLIDLSREADKRQTTLACAA